MHRNPCVRCSYLDKVDSRILVVHKVEKNMLPGHGEFVQIALNAVLLLCSVHDASHLNDSAVNVQHALCIRRLQWFTSFVGVHNLTLT